MRDLDNRVTRLEGAAPAALSPLVRAWLGHPVSATELERASLDEAQAGRETIDWTGISADLREWLSQETAA